MSAGQEWTFVLDGLGSTALGWALSGLSRSYREHRAQLLAKEKAAEARMEAQEEARWDKMMTAVAAMQSQCNHLQIAVARLEGAVHLPVEGTGSDGA